MEATHSKPFSNIKLFYRTHYPGDPLGRELKNMTFLDLYEHLKAGDDVYRLIGVDDSIVRERLFFGLSEVMGCEYRVIYRLWMYN